MRPSMTVVALLAGPVALGGELQPIEAPPVELLDAGAAPHVALRLTPAVGAEEQLQWTSTVHSVAEVTLFPDPEPFVQHERYTLALDVREVSDDAIRYGFRVTGVTVTPAAEGSDPAGLLEGVTGEVWMDRTGRPLAAGLDEPVDDAHLAVLQGVRDRIARLPPRLPDDPVGIGARWRVVDVLDLDVLAIDIASTWTLEALDGDSASLSVVLTASSDQDTFEITGEEGTVSGEVEALEVSGGGTFVQPLGRVFPAERAATGDYHVAVKARRGLIKVRLTLDVDDDSALSALPSAAPR